jgi:hypothetical protein
MRLCVVGSRRQEPRLVLEALRVNVLVGGRNGVNVKWLKLASYLGGQAVAARDPLFGRTRIIIIGLALINLFMQSKI